MPAVSPSARWLACVVSATLCNVIDAADALSEPEFQPDYDPVHRFSAWLERAGKAEATVEAYHADVADLVRAFVPRPVDDLLPADLSDYLQARATFEGWSVPTVRRHLQAIKSFYRYLVTEEEIRAPGPRSSSPSRCRSRARRTSSIRRMSPRFSAISR